MTGFRVVIPARYASTRLPGKPLRNIGGEIMIARVHARACASGAVETVVATDDDRVLHACRERGIDALMTSVHHRSGTDRCAEVADTRGWGDDDIVVNVQGDEPLVPPDLIAVAAQALATCDADLATLACPFEDIHEFNDPNTAKIVCDARGRALLFSRATIPYMRDRDDDTEVPRGALRHIGLYAYRVAALRTMAGLPPCELEQTESLEQLRALWHGLSIQVATTERAPGPGVDTEEDVRRVEAWLRSHENPGDE